MQTSDNAPVAQILDIEKDGNKSLLMESKTGKIVEYDKGGDMNKKVGDWNVVTGRKSFTKKGGSPKNQNLGAR